MIFYPLVKTKAVIRGLLKRIFLVTLEISINYEGQMCISFTDDFALF